ncbi:MAG: DnaA ATPase domain-containing protein [Betaproteobacteria bacterium]
MRQLALDLIAGAEPSLDNFVVGPNAEIVAVLRAAAAGPCHPPRIHVWGETASGKTHLLRALAAEPLGPHSPLESFRQAEQAADAASGNPLLHAQGMLIAVDDCDRLDEARQIALFSLFNRVAADERTRLVTSSTNAPLALDHLRPELRTRLGSGLVLALRPLSDADREQALRDAARASGVQCAEDVFRYLLTRKARDLRSLLRALSELARFAREKKRPLTGALAREFALSATLFSASQDQSLAASGSAGLARSDGSSAIPATRSANAGPGD